MVGSEFQGGESCRVLDRFIEDAASALTVGVSQAASVRWRLNIARLPEVGNYQRTKLSERTIRGA